jgi:hypothetical protein
VKLNIVIKKKNIAAYLLKIMYKAASVPAIALSSSSLISLRTYIHYITP